MDCNQINFTRAVTSLYQLYIVAEKPQTDIHQKTSCALNVLAEVKKAFTEAKGEAIKFKAMNFGQASIYCKSLEEIQSLIFEPLSPFCQISKMKMNNEPIPDEEKIDSEIAAVKTAIVAVSFNALNRQLEEHLSILTKSAQEQSTEIKKKVCEYSICNVTPEHAMNASLAVEVCLNTLLDVIIDCSSEVEKVMASLEFQNIERSYLSQTDLDTFKRLMDGFYTEFSKISNSLTYFAEQNDQVARELYYHSEVKQKLSPQQIANISPGNIREPLKAIVLYQEQVEGYTKDLNTLIQNSPDAMLKIIRAYNYLDRILEAKHQYVEDEIRFNNRHLAKLEKKLKEAEKQGKQMKVQGTFTKQQIQNVRSKTRHREEVCIKFEEYVKEFKKAARLPIFARGKQLLKDTLHNPLYSPYITRSNLDFPLEVVADCWLTAPLQLCDFEEIERTITAFRIYDTKIEDLRANLKNFNSQNQAAIHPFIALESKILGTS